MCSIVVTSSVLVLTLLMLITRRIVIVMVYTWRARIKFSQLAKGLRICPFRLLTLLVFSCGYTPSVQLWLSSNLGIPESAFPKPLWFFFQKTYIRITRLLLLSGFSEWVWRRESLKALKKEERDIEKYIRKYRRNELGETTVILLQDRLYKISQEIELLKRKSTGKTVSK
jgi:hypothetical protein